MQNRGSNELILLPSLKAMKGPRGGLVLTQKYMNGASVFAKNWPGSVSSLVELRAVPTTDMDHVEVMPGEADTGLELRPTQTDALAARLKDVAVVLAFLSPAEMPLVQLCNKVGVPVVFVSEYSLQTEHQIIRAQTRNPILRWRRQLWIRKSEQVRLKMLPMSSGLQCSGTPTYNVYQGMSPQTLLFFDNRVSQDMVINDADFAQKTTQMAAADPLRLVFGGRLLAMKGVQALPQLAHVLRTRGVPFTFDIYGSGPLEDALAQQIKQLRLSDQVHLRGVRDFETGWVPALKQEADLFICCHPQGDPSSTYPEVMACGVPIAGYDNEAFSGIAAHSRGGWVTPTHDLEKLADTVERLHHNRAELIATADHARRFAGHHAFEPTMVRRTAHLVAASRLPQALKG